MNSSKLDFDKKLNSIGTRAHYVDIRNIRNCRSVLAKIRVSAHDLAIEKCRYSRILRQNRICRACDLGLVENEEHFLLGCVACASLHKDYLSKLHTSSRSYIKVSSSTLKSVKLIRISNCKNQVILRVRLSQKPLLI